MLPAGTGQDFGRTHGIPTDFDDAVRVALDGTARSIDLGRAEYRTTTGGEALRWFANVGSVGMSGAVAARANSMSKALGGRATFFYALVREFLAWQNTEVTVTLDDDERRGAMHDVIVANGRWHGGGMKLAPDALPDDGLFDVVLIGDVTKLDFVDDGSQALHGSPRPAPARRGAAERLGGRRRGGAAADRARGRTGRHDTRPLRDRARRAAGADAELGGRALARRGARLGGG